MLQFEDVHKTYKQAARPVHALRGLSLDIKEPGYFAVMGPSGSGKSTFLHLAAGLDRPDKGQISIAGESVAGKNERQLTEMRRRHVGVVFQQFNLIPTLTARENIALPGVMDGQARAWIDQRVEALLEQLGITDRADHRPDALSGGEQQRVAIARALLFEPAVLLADEPTGSLDSASADRLWRLLGELARKQQTTVVMVTHEPAAAAHCEKVFVLRDGVCHGQFEVNDLDASGVASSYQQLER